MPNAFVDRKKSGIDILSGCHVLGMFSAYKGWIHPMRNGRAAK